MKEKNMIFVGMPGCGKSVMSKLVAKKLQMEYIDTDKVIEMRYKKTPAELITTMGEQHFRDIESKIIKQYLSLSGKVISTGGGSVLRPENRKFMNENGFVIFVRRDISMLSQKNRPLSKNYEALKKMYEIRLPLYSEVADIVINNDSTVENCVKEIINAIKTNK